MTDVQPRSFVWGERMHVTDAGVEACVVVPSCAGDEAGGMTEIRIGVEAGLFGGAVGHVA